jgi:hypothetical protein
MSCEFEIIPTKQVDWYLQNIIVYYNNLLKQKDKSYQSITIREWGANDNLDEKGFFEVGHRYDIFLYDGTKVFVSIKENDGVDDELDLLEEFENIRNDTDVNKLAKSWNRLSFSIEVASEYRDCKKRMVIAFVVTLTYMVDGYLAIIDPCLLKIPSGLYSLTEFQARCLI